jgi:hypothetical protein
MHPSLSIEQAKELVALCRSGRLYEIDAWVSAGKSLTVPIEIKKTPLQVAVDLGFHSLVKLLSSHEQAAPVLNRALLDAVTLKRLDLVELLLEHGAAISSVPLINVLGLIADTIAIFRCLGTVQGNSRFL